MIATGLDRLPHDPARSRGRRYGLLAHGASVTADLRPAHLGAGRQRRLRPPAALRLPSTATTASSRTWSRREHERDPWTGIEPILSLYG